MTEGPFDPVLLDLSDADDYTVLVAAMHDYAGQLEHEADNEAAAARAFDYEEDAVHIAHLRGSAARLQRMLASIEQQLDANSDARKSVEGDS
ncbi:MULTISPECIES: hypothetical protein [unclassified Microbacterium]|uniref:hypothetical protein n=1 Tax=unclassified Microbacterium TaxID=2609290 RepID=UPI003018AB9C